MYVHRSGFDLRESQAEEEEAAGRAPAALWGLLPMDEASTFTSLQQQLSRLAPAAVSSETPTDFVAEAAGWRLGTFPSLSLAEEMRRVASLMQVVSSERVFTEGGAFGNVQVHALKKLLGLLKADNALVLVKPFCKTSFLLSVGFRRNCQGWRVRA